MKLLVCDIEGTIFKPHMIKSAQHASYIWTAIAEALGKDAEKEEIATQRKWRDGGYGNFDTGAAYIEWVNSSIGIHARHHLREEVFNDLIDKAPYYDGVPEFFSRLDRSKYTPIFISGGIQNLNHKACVDLGVDFNDSYASCEYFFDEKGKLDTELTFKNTCDFFGKQELIQIALRRHGLGPSDWVFIGDGINDVSVASIAPLSIGIAPVKELQAVATYSFNNFSELMDCQDLVKKADFFGYTNDNPSPIVDSCTSLKEFVNQQVSNQVSNLKLDNLEKHAYHRFQRECGNDAANKYKSHFFGIESLLKAGEASLALWEQTHSPKIPSAILQPFCSAAEIMVNVTLVSNGRAKNLYHILGSRYSLQKEIENMENQNLKEVLDAYRLNRNAIAHSYQLITVDAAHALARRTYENIQRMELLLNPFLQ